MNAISSFPFHRVRYSALLLTVMTLWTSVYRSSAQGGLNDLLYVVGTVTANTQGADWGYLTWGSGGPDILIGRRYAVYGKPGDPASANPFTRRGTAERLTQLAAIDSTYNRSLNLGEDPAALANTLVGLFPDLKQNPGWTPSQQLTWVMQNALSNPTNREYLFFAARIHPSIQMILGTGWAEPIAANTPTTFELREIDAASGADGAVVGRVTVVGRQPVILPPPDRPIQVPDNSPKGDLNIRLRWGEPAELRRLTLLTHGFNVWRLPRALAVSKGWVDAPPTAIALSRETTAKRVNQAPAFKRREFELGTGLGSAYDLGSDPSTFFTADDNGLGTPGAKPFDDGEEFCYFAVARDVLGREGLVSKGGFGTACRRLPPLVPKDVEIDNDYDPTRLEAQRLRITWSQNKWSTDPGVIPDTVTHYAIYRWTNHAQIHTNEYAPFSSLVNLVPHHVGDEKNTILDDASKAPRLAVNADQTFWYTVRAVKSNQCGLVFSGNSAPVFGVLRQRAGPDAPEGTVSGACGVPTVIAWTNLLEVLPQGADRTRARYHITCYRRDESIGWAELTLSNHFTGLIRFARHAFAPGENSVVLDYDHAVSAANRVTEITCTVGDLQERRSKSAVTSAYSLGDPREFSQQVSFYSGSLYPGRTTAADPLLAAYGGTFQVAAVRVEYLPNQQVRLCMDLVAPFFQIQKRDLNTSVWRDIGVVPADLGGCLVIHDPSCHELERADWRGWPLRIPDLGDCDHVGRVGNEPNCMNISMELRPKTKEWRLYRCVNDSAPTLIAQSSATYDASKSINRISFCDDAMPSVSAELCYYGQLVDESGNASPMKRFGNRRKVVAPPPTPALAAPEMAGDFLRPQVVLRWFCPPAGVDRFRIHIAEQGAPPPPPGGSAGSGLLDSVQLQKVVGYAAQLKDVLTSVAKIQAFIPEVFETGRVGADFQAGPNFEITARLRSGVKYLIFIQALNGYPTPGESLAYEFTWQPPADLQKVPWPARGLPSPRLFDDVTTTPTPKSDPRVQALLLQDGNFALDIRYPVGIRIGFLPVIGRVGPAAGSNVRSTEFASIHHPVSSPASAMDPNQGLFRRISSNPQVNGESVLPIAVYRIQVTNAVHRRVSGNLLQVTPMIESLPWYSRPVPESGGNRVTIPDLLVVARDAFGGSFSSLQTRGVEFLLRDTQPVILGATYAYYVVHFKANREIDQIIPAGEVTLPNTL